MKKILFLSLIVALLGSCTSIHKKNYQELKGAKRIPFSPNTPFGMVFIPQGSFIMGPSDQDVPFANVTTNQRVSVGAFYMDQSEITNNEYRQFVEWVEDSIVRTSLGMFKESRKRGDTTLITSKSKVGNDRKIIDWNSPYPKERDSTFEGLSKLGLKTTC